MGKVIDQQLSDQLRDLYLQNRQWLSDVLHLEDETRIFRKIYDQFYSTTLKDDRINVQQLNARLIALENHRNELKDLILQHQSLLESMIVDQGKTVGVSLIEAHTKIITEIRELFASDITVKEELSSI